MSGHVAGRQLCFSVRLATIRSTPLSCYLVTQANRTSHKQVQYSLHNSQRQPEESIRNQNDHVLLCCPLPCRFLALPHLQIFHLDFSDLFSKAPNPAAWSAVLAYSLVMIFDIGGAMFGLGNLAGLVQNGNVPGSVVTYLSAAAGTALGAVTGTTPLIIAAESAVGIKEGGRTGLVAVTVAGCFALSMFLAPLLQVGAAGISSLWIEAVCTVS